MARFMIPGGFVALASVLAASSTGCMPADPTGMMPVVNDQQTPDQASNGGPADNSPAAKQAIVKTQLALGNTGRIDVGGDLIVFGVGYGDDFYISGGLDIPHYTPPEGVHYIRPSLADGDTNSAVMIPGSDRLFGYDDFRVAGTKVALVRSTNAVSIFDTQTEKLVDIPSSTITLDAQTVGLGRDSQMRSDGDLIVTINEASDVADGNAIKVLDLSGTEPVVISLPNPPGYFDDDFDQAAVDAGSRQVVAVDWLSGDLHLWRLDDPSATPTSFEFGSGDEPASISPSTAIQFDGTHVMFLDDTNLQYRAVSLDVTTGVVTHFAEGPAPQGSDMALANGRFLYFLNRELADAGDAAGSYRSVIGSTADLARLTLASQLDRYPFRPGFVTESGRCVPTGKLIGYGKTVCITPDGSRTFLAGRGYPSTSYDFIQMSTGGAFTDFADPDGTSITGALMGSDIVCSSDVVAFRAVRQFDAGHCARREDLVLAFIRVDMLD